MNIYNKPPICCFKLDRRTEIRGKVILIEGTDGSGKRTQSDLLSGSLNGAGFPTQVLSIPNYSTPAGKIVGQCYLGKDLGLAEAATELFGDPTKVDPRLASLFYAAERYGDMPEIRRILGGGTNLVLDRWTESNMGHQGGKIDDRVKREEMFRWISSLEYDLLQLSRPDLKIFLHMPTEVAIALRERRGELTGEKADGHERNYDHLRGAEEAYLHMLDLYPGWHTIQCAPSGYMGSLKKPEEIAEEVYGLVVDNLPSLRNSRQLHLF